MHIPTKFLLFYEVDHKQQVLLGHMIRKLPQQKGNSGDFFYRSKTCRITCTLFSYSINYLKYKVFFLSSKVFYLKLKISIISERTDYPF